MNLTILLFTILFTALAVWKLALILVADSWNQLSLTEFNIGLACCITDIVSVFIFFYLS